FALVRIDAASASGEVVRLLEDEDARVRWAAISVLGRFKAKTYARELSKFMEDRDPLLRWSALKVLQGFEAKHLVGDVEKLLSHADEGVRADAVLAVELFQARHLLPDVARLLKDSSPLVRWSAIRVLHRFAEKTYRPDVERLLDDPDRDVKVAATSALTVFDARESAPLIIPDGTPSFSRLSSPNPFVHGGYARLAARTLEAIDDTSHWSVALSLGRLPDRAGVDDLAALGSHPQKEVRRSAVWILDQWSSPDAIQALQRAAAQEKDPDVLRVIRDALARAGKK
ncbi:MAG: HEAT repeat domain-containing protein, partial [Planctomycetes bacterium]|nr:HEAT repeat domain-containing protein [Planctomycetota bacterium]